MAKASILDLHKDEIKQLIQIGVSIRSAWCIIKNKIPLDNPISYDGFYKYCKRKKII